MAGLDRWGRGYASCSKSLWEQNALAEGVAERTEFVRGDACRLPFEAESFDVITSSCCRSISKKGQAGAAP